MDYIYDIVLNFHKLYYEFYEWKVSDNIQNINKIPIYKIASHDYLNIKNNNTTIDTSTLPKNNKIFLITNNIEIIGVLIDKKGHIRKKSSLIYEDSDKILKDIKYIKKIKIKYIINKKYNKMTSRVLYEKNKFINKNLVRIINDKDVYKIKYLYYDIFKKEESNVNKIKADLIDLSKKQNDLLYESLKKLNIEFNK